MNDRVVTEVFPVGLQTKRRTFALVASAFRPLLVCGLMQASITAALAGTCQDELGQDFAAELPRLAPTEPADALGTFEVSPGLQIELLAAEPLVVDPVAIAFDEFARAFVVEMRGYSEQAESQISRVRQLVDENGDGRFDRATIFADSLRWPTAVVCLRGGILVADAPDILFFRDVDGDGQADERAVVLTGFGTQNVQQLLNNFQWGLDQQLYLATGGNGGALRYGDAAALASLGWPAQLALDRPLELGGRDLVIDPLTLKLQLASGGGQFGMTFDRWGNRYVCSNSDHCQQIVIEDRYLARNPLLRVPSSRVSIASDGPAAEVFRISPIEPWRTVRTRLRVQGLVPGPIEGGGRAGGYFTSATGITGYDGDVLPEEYTDSLFIGDVGSNLVHRKRLIDEGIVKSAVRVESGTEFLRSRDNWFRPVQCAVGPDGALTVLDMYRENVEHPASLPPQIRRHLDLNSGNDRGRIYRVVPIDYRTTARDLPGTANDAQLVAMLEHPNGWHRATAARLIRERWNDSLAALVRQRSLKAARPETRIRALYLLAADPRTLWSDLGARTQDDEVYVRAHAARVAEHFLPDSLPDLNCSAIADPDERASLQVALSLGEANSSARESVAGGLADLALRGGESEWLTLAIATSATPLRVPLITRLLPRTDAADADRVSPRLVRELLREVVRAGDDEQLHEIALQIQDACEENPQSAGPWLAALAEGGAVHQARIQRAFGGAEAYSGMRELVVRAASVTVRDAQQALRERMAALDVLQLATADHFAEMVPDLLTVDQPPEIRAATLATAGTFDSLVVAQAIATTLPMLSPDFRSRACQLLAARADWTGVLLDAIETNRLSPVLVDAALRQQLLRSDQPEIAARAERLLATSSRADRAALVAEYSRKLEHLQGDVGRGRAIFRQTCAACHRLEQTGQDVGKNLAAAANQGESILLQNILDPNQEVDSRYLAYVLLLQDGRSISGVISSETSSSVSLRTADGQSLTVVRDEIESIRSTTMSLMPENLENDLSPQAMADLLAYLRSQRG